MSYSGWYIEQLRFTGEDQRCTALPFAPGLSLIYGASNTGKSFGLKALDFMLGGTKHLPNIREREPYDKVWLDVAFTDTRRVTLSRAIRGGAFQLSDGESVKTLAATHNANNPANVSMFLLSQFGANGRKIAVDTAGTHNNLSFRDIAHLLLTDEISIQAESSPVESGNTGSQTRERNVLKYLLTGQDDAAFEPIVKAKDFRTGRSAKAAVLQEMIDSLNSEIENDYPDPEGLKEQSKRLDDTLTRIEGEIANARASVRGLLDRKRRLSSDIAHVERRGVEIGLSLESFEQLEEVYTSDIARLESIEEVGFLLGLDGKSDCAVCGAPPSAQAHTHGLVEIEDVRTAAEIEIVKIKRQRAELIQTVVNTKVEANNSDGTAARLRKELRAVEDGISEPTPEIDDQQRQLGDVVSVRDHVLRGMSLVVQRDQLIKQKEDIEGSKPPKRDTAIERGISTQTAKDFADVVSDVLLAWRFPGQKQVLFDLSTYDLIIDGKERRNNGKGVRAITHAAFKVALLLFCRERNLPHPGFIVLDTPLLTYRDPMTKPNTGPLASDEQELKNTDLKERFFDHLSTLGLKAQVMVFENLDPPKSVEGNLEVVAFTNDPDEGRQGVL